VIDRVLARNPKAGICGLTATPNRGDGKGLREVFSNVADQITLGEMIASGHLVPPRTFVIDVGAQEALGRVRRTAHDFDMDEVAAILNTAPITQAVIGHWKEKAPERKTIVFCSTVAHAENVTEAFVAAGVAAVLVHGELSDAERKARLADYETGTAQVVVNVAVLTEGYDYTPTELHRAAAPEFLQIDADSDGRPRTAHRGSRGISRRSQDRLHRPRLRHGLADARLAGAGGRSRWPTAPGAKRRPRNVPSVAPKCRWPAWSARCAATSGNAITMPCRWPIS
jgi:hypothetical protein